MATNSVDDLDWFRFRIRTEIKFVISYNTAFHRIRNRCNVTHCKYNGVILRVSLQHTTRLKTYINLYTPANSSV